MAADFPTNPSHISIEDIARYPLPGTAVPASFTFSPDGKYLTFLWSPERSLSRGLFAYDLATGEIRQIYSPPGGGATDQNVSPEEALRRERQRQREYGVTSYCWAENAMRLLVPLRGDIYTQDGLDGEPRKVFDSQTAGNPAVDPQISPDGEWVAYVLDAELFAVSAAGGEPRQLTSGARGTSKSHALAEYVAQEEMGRSHGFWWSPDSRSIAFTEVDESHIPIYRIVHQGKDQIGPQAQEDHHYPFAGQANAAVRLGVVSLEGDLQPVWMDLSAWGEDFYLARVAWFTDGSLAVQLENRQQSRLDLARFDPSTGQATILLSETSSVWINLHDLFRPLRDGFIWASERTGFRHLYLHRLDGTLVRQLTSGPWMVDSLCGVDENRQVVYFNATQASPLESQLYALSLDGGEPARITYEPGTHAAGCNQTCTLFVDTFQSIDQPPLVRLRSLADGAIIAAIAAEPDPRLADLSLAPPELVTLENRHGDRLYGAIFRPPETFGSGPFPTIVSVYGGPHAQTVINSWGLTANIRAQYLRSQGFLVFMLDNRGSARRGLQFEAAIRHRMGQLEVEDQVDGVRWLVSQGSADPDRVGIYGWSYGGYMALMCLARAPDTFKAAVAGAPVTAWDGYDTHYTERYMGTPQSNPEGYQQGSVMAHSETMRGNLLLVHGLIDENVHFRHTARLINALTASRKPYRLLLFPDERHMPRRLEDRVYMEQQIATFFQKHLDC